MAAPMGTRSLSGTAGSDALRWPAGERGFRRRAREIPATEPQIRRPSALSLRAAQILTGKVMIGHGSGAGDRAWAGGRRLHADLEERGALETVEV